MVSIVAIIGIVVMEAAALLMGHNGTILALSMSLVAGIGGYKLSQAGDLAAIGKAKLGKKPKTPA